MIVEDLVINEVSQPIEQDLLEILLVINKLNDEHGWNLSEEEKLKYAKGFFEFNKSSQVIEEEQVYYYVTESDYIQGLINENHPSYEEKWEMLLINLNRFLLERKLFNHIDSFIDVEDLAQDTLIGVKQAIKYYSYRSKFTTWLFTVAIRVSQQHYRYSKAQKRDGNNISLDSDLIDISYLGTEDINSDVEYSELLQLVIMVLQESDARYPKIMVDKFILNKRIQDIAEPLKLSSSSVMRLTRNLQRTLHEDPRIIEYLEATRSY